MLEIFKLNQCIYERQLESMARRCQHQEETYLASET